MALLFSFAGSVHAAEDELRVLMLYGIDPYLPPFLTMDKAMRDSLVGNPGPPLHIFTETLDSQRIALEKLEPELLAMLEKKYEALHINVVVAVSRTALDFFMRHGEQLWPGARVVYVGFLGYELSPSALPPGGSAVVSILDAAGTIDIARRLQPDARRIVVVAGSSEVDKAGEQRARAALAKSDARLSVEYISGAPMPELMARLAAEPADGIVVYLTQFRDRNGRPHEPFAVLRVIMGASGGPVYAAAEPYIGLGVVAGSVASYETRGRLVGEQVRRALAGETPDAAHTVLEAPNRCAADARAMKRWSLNPARLPDDCDIRFATIPIWRQYWWQIGLTLAIVAAQALLITALLAQRRRRRAAEEAEQAQRNALARGARLAMAGELTGAIAHEINQPLGAILTNVDTGELMLDSDRDRREDLRAILEDIRRDDLRASAIIQRLRDLLGKQKVARKAVDLDALVSDLESIMRAEARRRGISLEVRRASAALTIMGDHVQLQQVLINLVLNAMDAVSGLPENRKTVAVGVERKEGHAVLTVTDRGRGIAPKDLSNVFESFYSTKPNGMGLGLSITRTIVEAHGGEIDVESTPDAGTVFRVQLPLVVAGEPSSQPT
ncbi:MAG: sensor histidine kinase [Burkholderiales bacterium]